MAWLNDTVPGPSSLSHKRKEPKWTEQTKQTRPNWQSSIIINRDEHKQNWHKVTLKDFLSYIQKKPKWLYGKLWTIHKQFDNVTEDCEAWLAKAELYEQAKDSKIILMRNWLKETTEWLNQMTINWDAYTNKIVYDILHLMDCTITAGG